MAENDTADPLNALARMTPEEIADAIEYVQSGDSMEYHTDITKENRQWDTVARLSRLPSAPSGRLCCQLER